MRVATLIPLVVLGAIGWHSQAAIKERLSGVVSVGDKIATKQRMSVVVRALKLAAVGGDAVRFRSQDEFRQFVRASIRTQDRTADVSLDAWGSPYRIAQTSGQLAVISAGPDGAFGTGDDLSAAADLYDY